jgi:hypothetical protein
MPMRGRADSLNAAIAAGVLAREVLPRRDTSLLQGDTRRHLSPCAMPVFK